MSKKHKFKFVSAGHTVADAAKNVVHKIAEGAEKAVDFVKEKTDTGDSPENSQVDVSTIKRHMNIIASCGTKVGVVRGVEGRAIKLTKSDSPDGLRHFIPLSWVEWVDESVHLNKNSKDTEESWMAQILS